MVSNAMKQRIDEARKAGDTVGGAFVVVAVDLPSGLGSHVDVITARGVCCPRLKALAVPVVAAAEVLVLSH